MSAHRIVTVEPGRVPVTRGGVETVVAASVSPAAALTIAIEYRIPYHVAARACAYKEACRLRGNTRHYLPAHPLLAHMRRDGITQDTLARRCQVNKWTVYRWHTTGVVEVHTADRVAAALGCPAPELWGHHWTAVAALMDGVHPHRKEPAA